MIGSWSQRNGLRCVVFSSIRPSRIGVALVRGNGVNVVEVEAVAHVFLVISVVVLAFPEIRLT